MKLLCAKVRKISVFRKNFPYLCVDDLKEKMVMEEHSMTLAELNTLVRRGIRACLPDAYWIQAELSDVRANYSGHCYLEFIQKDPKGNSLVAKARGIIA